jgi:isopenicillin N synthase-like dioxygenase
MTNTTTSETTTDESSGVPVIDLSLKEEDESKLVDLVAHACRTYGFFQVIHHGIDASLQASFRNAMHQYFTELDEDIKNDHRRRENNARGYFDDEYTKQTLDWKRALDVGMPGSRNWNVPDDDVQNQNCLDGWNQIPTEQQLPGFRKAIVQWFQACEQLSHTIATIMTAGIWKTDSTTPTLAQAEQSEIVQELKHHHTSYLRMNYYPVCENIQKTKTETTDNNNHVDNDHHTNDVSPLGISPHKDAGFLTVLLQDDDCHSLQVWSERNQTWHTVRPIPGALTINTGDMAQIWSNGIYQAPLHRVLAHPTSTRTSAPFFYNPGYATWIRPVVGKISSEAAAASPQEENYHPCLWGYFRAVRFAGDLVNDLGVEIQMEDFRKKKQAPSQSSFLVDETTTTTNRHVIKQSMFAQTVRFDEPFSVQRFRDFLKDDV